MFVFQVLGKGEEMVVLNDYVSVIRGKQNKEAGKLFERLISTACYCYREYGRAIIEKTPEPMKPIKSMGGGKFVAVFEKKAQPDFKGTLAGGKTVIFEAKHTMTDRIKRDVVTPHQSVMFEIYSKFGAVCFVLVSFGMEDFFRIPWEVFKDMKQVFGRAYVKAADLEEYRVELKNGILMFLDD